MNGRKGDDIRKLFDVGTRPIDPIFESVYEGGPFRRCLECEGPFFDGGQELFYVIMKVFVHDETIVELAMCEKCRSRMRQEISDKSKEAITRFIAERFRPSATIDSCAICQRRRDTCRSATVYAYCFGSRMIVHDYPLMICDRCEETIQEMMSDETRGWQQDFMDRHFSGPSLEVGPKLSPVLI